MSLKIKKGDNVIMLSGKDKGKKGKVMTVLAEDGRVRIEGLNKIKKHLRAKQQGQKGQVLAIERGVSISSVALVCKACGKPTRIGYKIDGDIKSRVCKKCGAEQ